MGCIAITTWAGVNADVDAFLRREAIEHPVVERDEAGQHFTSSPGIPWIVAAGETSFGEVDRYPFRTSFEGLTDVLLAFVDEVRQEPLACIARHLIVERIK